MKIHIGLFAAGLLFCANGATAQPAERTDLPLFNDVAKTVNRYDRFTILDDIVLHVKHRAVTLEGKVHPADGGGGP